MPTPRPTPRPTPHASPRRRSSHDEANTSYASPPAATDAVYLCAIDRSPLSGELVRLNHSLIQDFEASRTALMIKHDAPASHHVEDSLPIYHSWMRHDLLLAFVQTLTTGRLCFCEHDVSFEELSQAFHFEGGFELLGHASRKSSELSVALYSHNRRMGLANARKRKFENESYQQQQQQLTLSSSQSQQQTLTLALGPALHHHHPTPLAKVFDQIAASIVSWPRLSHALEHTQGALSSNCRPPNFSCSATRVVLKLLNAPEKIAETTSGDSTFDLCGRRTCWLMAILSGLGMLRNELVESRLFARDDYSSQAFMALQRRLESDPVFPFVCVLADAPRCCAKQLSGSSKHSPSSFANECINSVLTHGSLVENSAVATDQVKYSRAAVSLSLKVVKTMPRLASLLSLSASEEAAWSQERVLFQKSLKDHGLRVIAWNVGELGASASSITPLLFPPSLRSVTQGRDAATVVLECTPV